MASHLRVCSLQDDDYVGSGVDNYVGSGVDNYVGSGVDNNEINHNKINPLRGNYQIFIF
jgi:hypothetical protein